MNEKHPDITKEQIERLYIHEGRSSIETAAILGCTKKVILGKMAKFDIKRRTVSQALTGKTMPDAVKEKMSVSAKERQQGESHTCWKGGRIKSSRGYILIWKKEHPGAGLKGYVSEHRLIMEDIIGRYLTPEEEVHHKNFIRSDNNPDNLQLFANHSEHMKAHKGMLRKHQQESCKFEPGKNPGWG